MGCWCCYWCCCYQFDHPLQNSSASEPPLVSQSASSPCCKNERDWGREGEREIEEEREGGERVGRERGQWRKEDEVNIDSVDWQVAVKDLYEIYQTNKKRRGGWECIKCYCISKSGSGLRFHTWFWPVIWLLCERDPCVRGLLRLVQSLSLALVI